jgi:hypothetical protein
MAKTDTKKPKRRTSSTEVLRAPPINPAGRLAAQTSAALQQVANSVVPNPIKLLSGDIDTLPIGDWVLGDTTGMLDRWSKGRAPVTLPAYGSKLVNAKFDPAIIDALSVVAPGAKPAILGAKTLGRSAKHLAPDIASMAERYALPMQAYAVPPETGRAAFLAQWGGNRPVQRASIKELQEKVRQERGNYGAQRVERAADKVPNLEQQYTQNALEKAFTESNPQALAIITPKHFEEYAEPIPPGLIGSLDEYRGFNVPEGMTYDQYINHLAKISKDSGFADVPYLNLDKTLDGGLRISGHEGRHRMRALDQLGDESTLIRVFPRESFTSTDARRYKEDYIEALKASLGLDPTVSPEVFPDVKLPMPEVFAGGGIVKAAGKGLRGLAEKYRLAHEIAQKNAALPVSKGGLGLPPDNTALDRAKALGFDIYNKYFHGTGDDFTEFYPNSFFTTKPESASTYALDRGNTYAIDMRGDPLKAANVMSVYVKAKKYADDDTVIKAAKKTKVYDPEIEDSYYYTSPNYDNFSAKAAPLVIAELKKKGYDAAKHYDFDMSGNEIISSQFFEPNQIRSTSAAFDPFRRGEADILAGIGVGLPVSGLVNQEPVKKAKGGKVGHPNEYVEKVQSWGRRGQMDLANRLGMGDEVKFAATIPEKYYPASEQHNGPGDAMRHLLLQAQLQQKYGELPAKAVGWGHELVGTITGESPAEKEMDDYNDALGRKIGAEASDKADMAWRAMQAIKSGEAHTIQHPKEDAYAHGGEVDYDKHYEFVQHTPISSTIDHDAMYMFRDEVQGFAKGGPVLSVGRGEKLPVAQGAGLTAKGRAKYNSATGGNLKAPAPHPKTEKDANRRKSFCARMSGMPGPMKDENGNPTRKAASLKRWNC